MTSKPCRCGAALFGAAAIDVDVDVPAGRYQLGRGPAPALAWWLGKSDR